MGQVFPSVPKAIEDVSVTSTLMSVQTGVPYPLDLVSELKKYGIVVTSTPRCLEAKKRLNLIRAQ